MKNIATVVLFFVLCSVTVHAQWSLTGNSGTTPGTNFIGTTDAKDLVFKTNSIERGRILNASGTWRFGGSSNFVKIDSTGSMTFAGTAAYKVANNKYAFQAQANPNYGLFFNATSLQYEFRNASAAPMLSIGAATGNGIFTGTLKIGAYTLPATDGSNGQLLKTNGTGALTWQGDDNTVYTPGTGIDITGTTITNTAPDQLVSLSGTGATGVSGTYPNFIISSTDNNSGGTVTSIATGTGLAGGTITTSGTISLVNSGVTAGTYGTSVTVPVFTVDSTGRITSASTTASSLANLSLSNLTATSVNQSLIPSTTNSKDLGSSALGWKDVYATGSIYFDGSKFIDNRGTRNIFIGKNAGTASAGISNIAIGNGALKSYTHGFCVAVGDSALANNLDAGIFGPDNDNTAVGYASLTSNTTGIYNAAYGYLSLFSNTVGLQNVACGAYALYFNTTGSYNVATGLSALYANTTGHNNTAIGTWALTMNISGAANTASGFEALYSDTSGSENTASGLQSLYLNKAGNYNTADGAFSLYNNFSGHSNVAIGFSALINNSTISNLVAVGDSAMFSNSTGVQNTAIGSKSLYSNTNGFQNTANGFRALFSNNTGSSNTASGSAALVSNTSGSANTVSGYEVLALNLTGSRNTASGFEALFNTSGNSNTGYGYKALYLNAGGSHNTAIGDSANVSSGSFTNASALGSHAFVSASNSIVLGSISGVNGATSSVNVGIGTSSPARRLHVVITGASGGSANGNAGIVMENNNSSYFQILSPDANENGVLFGTASNNANGAIVFNNSSTSNGLQFRTGGNNTRVRINSNGKVAIGSFSPSYRLQLNVDSAAKPSTATWTISSDERLKTNVSDFNDGLDVLNKIHPVWFEYNGKAGMPTGIKSVGILAQEMQKIAPYMIGSYTYEDSLGNKTDYLDYNANALFYILVNSVKQQQVQMSNKDSAIESLQSAVGNLQNENAALQSRLDKIDQQMQQFNQSLNDCCTKNQSSTIDGTAKITISNETIGALLGQNIPNPFDNSTLIPFRIPKDCSDASIVIAESATGRIVRVVPVSCSEAQLTLEAGTLASGSYSYTLYVDGKQIDTKQMVLVK